MRVAEKHIRHYNRLNGNLVSKRALQKFHAALKKDIDARRIDAHIPLGIECLDIEKKLRKAIKNMNGKLVKVQLKPVSLNQKHHHPHQSPYNAKGQLIYGLDQQYLHGLECNPKEAADEKQLGFTQGGQQKIYDMVTQMILKAMQKEGLFWRMPWKLGSYMGENQAQNFATKNNYRGANFWITNFIVPSFGYKSIYFLTFNQAKELGGKVKKGATSWPIVYYNIYYVVNKPTRKVITEQEYKALSKEQRYAQDARKIPFIQYYSVFNADEIEGIKFPKIEVKELPEKERIESAENIVQGMPKRPPIKTGGARAFYQPGGDFVQMPPIKTFNKEQEYYSTLFHELVHSTGHASRLSREFGKSFGDSKYAFEELIAELGASYLCAESGILYFTLDNSAAYLKSWQRKLSKAMKADNKFFLKAAAKAQQAADFILDIKPGEEKKPVEVKKPKATKQRKPAKRKIKQMSVPGVKASVAKAVADLVEHKPKEYGKKAMAMQVLYSTFKDHDVVPLEDDKWTFKLIEKEQWIEYADDNTYTPYVLDKYQLSERGKEIIRAIDGRLTSLRVKKQGGELFPDLKGVSKKQPSGLSGVLDASALGALSFRQIELTDPYKKIFGKLYSDNQMMVWGLPGSGKSVEMLKFSQYLAEKMNLKVLYLANEEWGRSTLTEKIRDFKIGHPNLMFAKDFNALATAGTSVNNFDVVFMDSVQSMGMSLDDYKKFVAENPGRIYVSVIQSTKDGDFRGGKDWEHEMDIAGEVRGRKLILRKNRLDPHFASKSDSILTDEIVAEKKKAQHIKDLVKGKIEKKEVTTT